MQVFTLILALSLIGGMALWTLKSETSALAQGAHNPTGTSPADATTPEEKMRRRFPQPVRIGALIGTRVLDYDDVTVGWVRQVVRMPTGKLSLIVDFGGWFGF